MPSKAEGYAVKVPTGFEKSKGCSNPVGVTLDSCYVCSEEVVWVWVCCYDRGLHDADNVSPLEVGVFGWEGTFGVEENS